MAKTRVHIELQFDDLERTRFDRWVSSYRQAGHVRHSSTAAVRDAVFTAMALAPVKAESAPERTDAGTVRVRVNPREDADRWWRNACRLADRDKAFARYVRKLESSDDDIEVPLAWVEKARSLRGWGGAPLIVNGALPKYAPNVEIHFVLFTPPLMKLLREHSERTGIPLAHTVRQAIGAPLKWLPDPRKSKDVPLRHDRREPGAGIHVRFTPEEWSRLETRALGFGLNESVLVRAHVCAALLQSPHLLQKEKAAIDESWLYYGGRADRCRGRHKPWASSPQDAAQGTAIVRRLAVYMRPEMKVRLRDVSKSEKCMMNKYALNAVREHGEAVEAWIEALGCAPSVPAFVCPRYDKDVSLALPLGRDDNSELKARASRLGLSDSVFVRACVAWRLVAYSGKPSEVAINEYKHWIWHGTPSDHMRGRGNYRIAVKAHPWASGPHGLTLRKTSAQSFKAQKAKAA